MKPQLLVLPVEQLMPLAEERGLRLAWPWLHSGVLLPEAERMSDLGLRGWWTLHYQMAQLLSGHHLQLTHEALLGGQRGGNNPGLELFVLLGCLLRFQWLPLYLVPVVSVLPSPLPWLELCQMLEQVSAIEQPASLPSLARHSC